MCAQAQANPAPTPVPAPARPNRAMLGGPEPLPMFHMVVVAKYLDGLQDFINLEKTCKGYRGLGAAFHTNPIDIGRATAYQNMFPNVNTLSVYGQYAGPYTPPANYSSVVYWRYHDEGNASVDENEDDDGVVMKGLQFDHEIPNTNFCVVRFDGRCGSGDDNITKRYSIRFTVKKETIFFQNYQALLEEKIRPFYGGFITPINCSLLHEIDISEAPITVLYDNAFAWCANLRSVKLPDVLERVGRKVFYQTPLEELTVNLEHPIRFAHDAFYTEYSYFKVLFIYDSSNPNRQFTLLRLASQDDGPTNLDIVCNALNVCPPFQRNINYFIRIRGSRHNLGVGQVTRP